MTFIVSLIFLIAAVIDYGFVLYPHEDIVIEKIYHYSWIYYLIIYMLRLLFKWKTINRKTSILTIMIGILLLLSIVSHCFTPTDAVESQKPLWQLLNSKYYLLFVLILFSLIEVSKGIVRLIGKRTNPAMLLAQGFFVIIIIGTILLLLPKSTAEHIQLTVVDALFISTSAVCVTGLTPIDISTAFTVEGQMVIALLIQIGGLGVMTITSFFAMFFMGHTGFYNQFALKDMVSSETMASFVSTLLYILGFTFIIEAVGALFIWLNIHNTLVMSIPEELFFSCFHAISAFCNAGFSTLSGNLGNETLMNGHNGLYLIISMLIILGGIGFPILVNIKDIIIYHIKRSWYSIFQKKQKLHRYNHVMNINTKLVISWTVGLILIGFVVILLMEWNNAFAGMPVIDKIVHSLFNSVSPRTAGFNSVELTHFSFVTLLLYMVLMWIGGGAQSTAGGIKVNAFAVSFSNFISAIKGEENLILFGREVSQESIRRAYATVFGSIIAVLLFFVLLVILEPGLKPMSLLFEVISALGTVGSSLNITPHIGDDSKILLSVAMFVGRVGLITILMSFIQREHGYRLKFPKGNIIIN